jgi:hypothetical protein
MQFSFVLSRKKRKKFLDLKVSFGKACKKAYKKALEPHHPILVRTAAKAAWLVAPERQKFYLMIAGTFN